ncbi:hypothetical protein PHYPSEUDO_008031 [Phytophthora pseudosyringae]|uniref:Uncharacterized protein n=1 Tax=Phytophthora pseudosyringae TaxID=221518 RepID=A0A8T1VI96_9STRA|nr:hypothetical protein PHYPSEUDO_008031 [Phytophthora pseudosyringae]
MFQFMTPALPSGGPRTSLPASEIERFRARHRRLCRGQQAASPSSSRIEALDVDEGRTRKISANWRHKQQQTQLRNQFDDGYWPKSAGTEMHLGFNAFDFSASPEAFCDDAEESVATEAPIIEMSRQDDDGVYQDQDQPEPASMGDDEQQKRNQHMADVAKQVTAMGVVIASTLHRQFFS